MVPSKYQELLEMCMSALSMIAWAMEMNEIIQPAISKREERDSQCKEEAWDMGIKGRWRIRCQQTDK